MSTRERPKQGVRVVSPEESLPVFTHALESWTSPDFPQVSCMWERKQLGDYQQVVPWFHSYNVSVKTAGNSLRGFTQHNTRKCKRYARRSHARRNLLLDHNSFLLNTKVINHSHPHSDIIYYFPKWERTSPRLSPAVCCMCERTTSHYARTWFSKHCPDCLCEKLQITLDPYTKLTRWDSLYR